MKKKYNTPHRSHVVKTRMTEEEYADFTERLKHYDMSQAEFIRQAITRATIRPIVTVSPSNISALKMRTMAQRKPTSHLSMTSLP